MKVLNVIGYSISSRLIVITVLSIEIIKLNLSI